MPRLLIHFACLGPYHHARLKAAADALAPLGWDVIGLEAAKVDLEYPWEITDSSNSSYQIRTAFPDKAYEMIGAKEFMTVFPELLGSLKPDAMAIAGWGTADARICHQWCRLNRVRRMVMSETRAVDGNRNWFKEWYKKRILRGADAAMVGAISHKKYLTDLGVAAKSIYFGYNVVDNDYFTRESAKWRGSELAPHYFLASSRFVERKNLLRLIDGYAGHAQLALGAHSNDQWDLCILGDGVCKADLQRRCHEHGLAIFEHAPWESTPNASCGTNSKNETSKHKPLESIASGSNSPRVYFPGFRQIEELPRFYASAGAFIHPALQEPWGLVVNEAMASGLPVLSSRQVGAAELLMKHGVTGYMFDPSNTSEIGDAMDEIAKLDGDALAEMGDQCRRILEENCPTQAFGRALSQWIGNW